MNSATASSSPLPFSPDNCHPSLEYNADNNADEEDHSTASTGSAAFPSGNRLRVAMHLNNALPEFCVELSKYTAGVLQKWRAEERVKVMFLEEVEGGAVRKPYLGTVCGTYVWRIIGSLYNNA